MNACYIVSTYGKMLREFVPDVPERYLTTQHERDRETGLDYRGARYYDSDVARFLSIDPWTNKYPAWSTYNYVMGNPIRLVDKNGKGPTGKEDGIVPVSHTETVTHKVEMNDNGSSTHTFVNTQVYVAKIKNEKGEWVEQKVVSVQTTKYKVTVENGMEHLFTSTWTKTNDEKGKTTAQTENDIDQDTYGYVLGLKKVFMENGFDKNPYSLPKFPAVGNSTTGAVTTASGASLATRIPVVGFFVTAFGFGTTIGTVWRESYPSTEETYTVE